MFYESFYGFFLDIFPPWILENNKILVLYVFKGEKFQSLNQEKIGENSLFVLFFSTGPIIVAKGMIWNNVQLSKIFFWKTSAIWDTLMDGIIYLIKFI